MASSKPDYLPKFCTQNTITVMAKASTYGFGGREFSPQHPPSMHAVGVQNQGPYQSISLLSLWFHFAHQTLGVCFMERATLRPD